MCQTLLHRQSIVHIITEKTSGQTPEREWDEKQTKYSTLSIIISILRVARLCPVSEGPAVTNTPSPQNRVIHTIHERARIPFPYTHPAGRSASLANEDGVRSHIRTAAIVFEAEATEMRNTLET